MHYLPEPKQDGAIAKTAVLLVNLGTPDAPTPQQVRRVSEAVLSDPRVIEIPRASLVADPARLCTQYETEEIGQEIRQYLSSEGSP